MHGRPAAGGHGGHEREAAQAGRAGGEDRSRGPCSGQAALTTVQATRAAGAFSAHAAG